MKEKEEGQDLSKLHNIESEQALLGAILIDNRAYDGVSEYLLKEHFYDPFHQMIFEAIDALIRAGRTATPVTVKASFAEDQVKGVDIPKYLSVLAGEAVSLINANDYGRTIYDLSCRRHLLAIGQELSEQVRTAPPQISPQSLGESAMGRLVEILHTTRGESAFLSSAQLAGKSLKLASEAAQSGKRAGLSFGYSAIDDLVAPVLPGQMIVIGGDTKMGKTRLTVQLSYMMARQGIPTAVRSLEMPPMEVNDSLLCSLADIDGTKLKNAAWYPSEQARLEEALIGLQKVPLYISGKGRESIDSLRSWATKAKKYHNAKLLAIDHLRFVDVPKCRDKFEKIGEAAIAIKDLAVQLEVAIVLCTQLNRSVRPEGYTGAGSISRPSLSNLYGASEIEQTADAVIFIHRPEHYLRLMEPAQDSKYRNAWSADMLLWENKVELICAIRRAGPSGQIRQSEFHGKRTWFGDYHQLIKQPEFVL